MKLVKLQRLTSLSNTVISTGNFDGIHLGHKFIIKKLAQEASKRDLKATLVILNPIYEELENRGKLLTTFDEKLELLSNFDLDFVVSIDFNEQIRKMNYRSFLNKIIFDQLDARKIIVGYDHKIGHDQKGNTANIRKVCLNNEVSLRVIEPIYYEGLPIKSSRVRAHIAEGEIEEANEMLGYEYFIIGEVVEGIGRGGALGTPTANLQVSENKLLPASGIYYGSVKVDKQQYDSAIYVGANPTFENKQDKHIEVHIFDFNEDIYGQEIKISFKGWVREDKKFSSQSELKKQLEKDKRKIRNLQIEKEEVSNGSNYGRETRNNK